MFRSSYRSTFLLFSYLATFRKAWTVSKVSQWPPRAANVLTTKSLGNNLQHLCTVFLCISIIPWSRIVYGHTFLPATFFSFRFILEATLFFYCFLIQYWFIALMTDFLLAMFSTVCSISDRHWNWWRATNESKIRPTVVRDRQQIFHVCSGW